MKLTTSCMLFSVECRNGIVVVAYRTVNMQQSQGYSVCISQHSNGVVLMRLIELYSVDVGVIIAHHSSHIMKHSSTTPPMICCSALVDVAY